MVNFSLTPTATTNTIIYYFSKQGVDINIIVTVVLQASFSVVGEELLTFTEKVENRSTAYDWDATNDPVSYNGGILHLINQFVLLSLDDLIAIHARVPQN